MNATLRRPSAESVYLHHLRSALNSLPQPDRTAIVAEIESHIAERVADGVEVATVLSRLGPPELFAQGYLEDRELSRALSKASPGALLASILGRATRSITALACGAVAVTLYLVGLAFASFAVLKPVADHNTGLWIGPGGRLAFGVAKHPPAGAREVLGFWIIPISIAVALVCYVIGTELLKFCGRLLLKRSGRALTT